QPGGAPPIEQRDATRASGQARYAANATRAPFVVLLRPQHNKTHVNLENVKKNKCFPRVCPQITIIISLWGQAHSALTPPLALVSESQKNRTAYRYKSAVYPRVQPPPVPGRYTASSPYCLWHRHCLATAAQPNHHRHC